MYILISTCLFQIEQKRSPEREREVTDWIEEIVGSTLKGLFEEGLKDGVMLCKYGQKSTHGCAENNTASAKLYSTIQCSSIQYKTIKMQLNTVQPKTEQYKTMQCSSVQ